MTYNYNDDAPTNQYPASKVPDAFGYLPIAIADDGETLCVQCVTNPTNPVHEHNANAPLGDGWGIVGWTSDGETESETDEHCAHCNKLLLKGYLPD